MQKKVKGCRVLLASRERVDWEILCQLEEGRAGRCIQLMLFADCIQQWSMSH
jgi:hypothetical protein